MSRIIENTTTRSRRDSTVRTPAAMSLNDLLGAEAAASGSIGWIARRDSSTAAKLSALEVVPLGPG